jgi:hypothetical protein
VNRRLTELVWSRAGSRCEYCLLPVAFSPYTFEIDHVTPQSHGGLTTADNLALACFHCNSFKGTNLSGIDPESNHAIRLFHPRRQRWRRHFRYDGPILIGQTAAGRATVATLRINARHRVDHRQALIDEGMFFSA